MSSKFTLRLRKYGLPRRGDKEAGFSRRDLKRAAHLVERRLNSAGRLIADFHDDATEEARRDDQQRQDEQEAYEIELERDG